MKISSSHILALGVVASCFAYGLSREQSSAPSKASIKAVIPSKSSLSPDGPSPNQSEKNLYVNHSREEQSQTPAPSVIELPKSAQAASRTTSSWTEVEPLIIDRNPYEDLFESLENLDPEETERTRRDGSLNYLAFVGTTLPLGQTTNTAGTNPIATDSNQASPSTSTGPGENGNSINTNSDLAENTYSQSDKENNPYLEILEQIQNADEQELLSVEEQRQSNLELYLSTVEQLSDTSK
jgi:hypothetical protein